MITKPILRTILRTIMRKTLLLLALICLPLLTSAQTEDVYSSETETAYDSCNTNNNVSESSKSDEGLSFKDIVYGFVGMIVLGLFFGKGKSGNSNGFSSFLKDILSSSSSQSSTSTNTYKPSRNQAYKPENNKHGRSDGSDAFPPRRETKVINVSVVCTNCGNTVVLNLRTDTCGGFSTTCYNCSGTVTGSYSWGSNDNVIIRNVRTMGGARK